MDTTFYIISAMVLCAHSFLNFLLCSRLSNEMRFKKISILFACIVNGLLSPFLLATHFSNPIFFYLIYSSLLIMELFILFKGRLTAIIGIATGSLLHLFVLRALILAIFALMNNTSMYQISIDTELLTLINIYSFAAQLVTLTMFITLIPLKILLKVMSNKSFYTGLLALACFLNVYLVYNSFIFFVDYYSVNLIVQEIVISLLTLSFFYIMMLLLIKIFNLDIYKEKNKELEGQIDKDKTLTSVVFNFAEIIFEGNCTKDKITRLLINSTERPTNHINSLTELLKSQVENTVHPDDKYIILGINSASMISDFENGNTESIYEYRAKKIVSSPENAGIIVKEDGFLWYRMRINLSKNATTSDIIALFTVDEIDDEKQLELKLREKAERDPLTGAYNKETFSSKVNDLLKEGMDGTLYMFDLDNFKGINDNMGHSAGDDVLREVYEKASSIFRSHDLVGRVGGDEFVVFLLGNTKESSIIKKATQICESINKTYYAQNGVNIEISSSVGISVAPKDGNDFETLFNAADLSMYHSKNSGKNTYTIYDVSISSGFKPQEKEDYMRIRNQQND